MGKIVLGGNRARADCATRSQDAHKLRVDGSLAHPERVLEMSGAPLTQSQIAERLRNENPDEWLELWWATQGTAESGALELMNTSGCLGIFFRRQKTERLSCAALFMASGPSGSDDYCPFSRQISTRLTFKSAASRGPGVREFEHSELSFEMLNRSRNFLRRDRFRPAAGSMASSL